MLCLVIHIIIMDDFLYRGRRGRIFVPYTSNTNIFKARSLINFVIQSVPTLFPIKSDPKYANLCKKRSKES